MPFKYEAHLIKLRSQKSSCPAVSANEIPGEFIAFRLVKGMELTPEDFLPPAILNLGRQSIGGRPPSCGAFALSYFETQTKVESFLTKILAQRGPLDNIGTHVARSTIQPSDGLNTQPDSKGHFDLYEYKSAQLETTSVALGKANCG